MNMVIRGETASRSNRTAFFLISLMLVALLPMIATPVSAAPSISLNVSPNSQTVNPGDSGEYTVRVTNTGSDPVTVNLQSSNERVRIAMGLPRQLVKSQAKLMLVLLKKQR